MQEKTLTYSQAVEYMSGLLTFGMKLDRERFSELLSRLGNPHLPLKCIHVAGTNGKGSTTTFIASILKTAGYTVGSYLSPYVFDLRERILVNGAMIGKEDFARHVSEIKPHIEAIAETELGQTTEFELKTAVAFRHFAEIAVDFAVIEVGIGGRLDATNVIPPPLVAVITNIGLDHQKILGETLELIAAEKAGILKAGTACCVTGAEGVAFGTIAAIAEERGVPLLRVLPVISAQEYDIAYSPRENGALVRLPNSDTQLFPLSLRGTFQAANAATAAATLSVLSQANSIAVSSISLKEGLRVATLPGRFQILSQTNGATLILDVAHNEDGATVLAESLKAAFSGCPIHFVVGMSKTHEPEPFLRILRPMASRITVTEPSFRPKPVEETLAAARSLEFPHIETVVPAVKAIEQAVERAEGDEIVVVTGSFYTVGETPESLRVSVRGAMRDAVRDA